MKLQHDQSNNGSLPQRSFFMSPPMTGVEYDDICILIFTGTSADYIKSKRLLLLAILFNYFPFLNQEWRHKELHFQFVIL